MTTLTIIWAILVVPTFAVFSHYSMQWAYEDLGEVTNNDKLAIYSISALLSMAWPLIGIIFSIKVINNYIDGLHGS